MRFALGDHWPVFMRLCPFANLLRHHLGNCIRFQLLRLAYDIYFCGLLRRAEDRVVEGRRLVIINIGILPAHPVRRFTHPFLLEACIAVDFAGPREIDIALPRPAARRFRDAFDKFGLLENLDAVDSREDSRLQLLLVR